MTKVEQYTIEHLTGATHHITDQHKCLAVLAYAKSRAIPKEAVIAIILNKRLNWLNWLTVTQRKWQAYTRQPSRARHSDSITLREQYVRC